MTHRFRYTSLLLALVLLLSTGAVPAVAQVEDDPNADQINEIIEETAALRGLEIIEPIDVTVMTREEFQVQNIEMLEEDFPPEDQEADYRTLRAFGVIDEGTDLGEVLGDVQGDGVLGYFDFLTQELVVIRDEPEAELTAMEELTLAHEVVHALQEQHFDADLLFDLESGDASLAARSLAEGDASAFEIEYLLSQPELLSALQAEFEELGDLEAELYGDAPPFIVSSLYFPYEYGAPFVQAILDEGGWESVNAVYENPPASTTQLMHPELYLDGVEPIDMSVVDPAEVLGEEWTEFDNDVAGEATVLLTLTDGEPAVDDDVAEAAAEGWRGDRYVVSGTEDETVLVWATTWASEDDALEFAGVFAPREEERHNATTTGALEDGELRLDGEEMNGLIRVDGSEVHYIMAPDLETVDLLDSGDQAEE